MKKIPAPWGQVNAVALLLMVAYGVFWETWWDPVREGSMPWLKVIPLALLVPGLWQSKMRHLQWLSLLIWIYFGEALVRIASPQASEAWLSAGWLLLSLISAVSIWRGARAYRRQMASGDSP